ncbi:MAG: DUF2207 domain-containing protein [Eubacteriales bacterium]
MKKVFTAAFSVLFILMIFCSSAFNASATYYPMDTKAFNVDIQVKESNVYDVTTTIKVFFNEAKHGIYYYLPYTGEVVRQINGKEVRSQYRNRISNISVPGYSYAVTYESGNVVFKVGDANFTLTGEQTYVIKYSCTIANDKITTMDDVYWNIFPLDWESPTGSPIQTAIVTVTMPKPFDAKNLTFIGGAYGETRTDMMNYSTTGTTITATLKQPLQYGEGVTMRLVLPEGYFVANNSIYVFMALIMLAAFGIILLLWFFYGRDEKIIPVVSFNPPKGMTSAETGYIIDGVVDDKDLISLLLFWASKGYLSLNQTGKKDFEIIKKRDLPADAKTYEKTMFDGLFLDRNIVTTDELKNKFYTTLDATKIMLKSYFSAIPENNLYTKKSVVARGFSVLLLIIPAVAFLLLGLYHIMADTSWYAASGMILFILFTSASKLISSYDKRKASSAAKYAASTTATVIVAGLAGIAMLAIGIFVIEQIALASMAVALTAISIFLAIRMKTRTAQSNKWMQEILGLKNFIEAAELDRIKMLVEETPEYFYNVLPFAYVFGLTDKWAENFEGIALRQPDWYTSSYPGMNMGYFNAMMFTSALNRSMNTVQNNMTVRPAPQGGGGSGGGGFSGGGFSGGGMGGGGGGSW